MIIYPNSEIQYYFSPYLAAFGQISGTPLPCHFKHATLTLTIVKAIQKACTWIC